MRRELICHPWKGLHHDLLAELLSLNDINNSGWHHGEWRWKEILLLQGEALRNRPRTNVTTAGQIIPNTCRNSPESCPFKSSRCIIYIYIYRCCVAFHRISPDWFTDSHGCCIILDHLRCPAGKAPMEWWRRRERCAWPLLGMSWRWLGLKRTWSTTTRFLSSKHLQAFTLNDNVWMHVTNRSILVVKGKGSRG